MDDLQQQHSSEPPPLPAITPEVVMHAITQFSEILKRTSDNEHQAELESIKASERQADRMFSFWRNEQIIRSGFAGVVLLAFLYCGKEALGGNLVAMEVLKVGAGVVVGALGGYGYARAKSAQEQNAND